jgi:hypothetical protein
MGVAEQEIRRHVTDDCAFYFRLRAARLRRGAAAALPIGLVCITCCAQQVSVFSFHEEVDTYDAVTVFQCRRRSPQLLSSMTRRSEHSLLLRAFSAALRLTRRLGVRSEVND